MADTIIKKSLPEGEVFVSMILHRDMIFVLSNKCLYQLLTIGLYDRLVPTQIKIIE
jgi:hypothetical protein